MSKITQSINELIENEDWFDYFPEQINHGNCDAFAYDIKKLVPKAKVFWADDWFTINKIMPPIGIKLSHCFVLYRNRFYDSECPEGTKKLLYLPFFQRQFET